MVGMLAKAVTARAESKFAFSWRAEPGATCLTEEKLRAAVEKKLGRSVFTALDAAEMVLEGEELWYRDRFRARVTVSFAQHESGVRKGLGRRQGGHAVGGRWSSALPAGHSHVQR